MLNVRPVLARSVCAWLIGLSWLTSAAAEVMVGKVIAVADGDTITVLDAQATAHKIRIDGIDAPEKGQAFGQRARQHLMSLAKGQLVQVTWRKVDRYGRKIATVRLPQVTCWAEPCPYERSIAIEQVAAGLAWWYAAYAHEQTAEDRLIFEGLERDARAVRRGLWSDPDPTAPWEWRQQRRERQAARR